MDKKVLLVKNYVVVENKDDLFFVFDKDYLKSSKESHSERFSLETQKYIFIFNDVDKIPFKKIQKLETVGIVINEDKKEKQHILEGVAHIRNAS